MFLSFAQTAFAIGLADALAIYAPSVSPLVVVTAGATKFRQVVEPAAIHGVILSYNKAIQHVFYIAAGASVAMFVVSFGMGWKDVRSQEVKDKLKQKSVEEGPVEGVVVEKS
jgi:hypothetical protein